MFQKQWLLTLPGCILLIILISCKKENSDTEWSHHHHDASNSKFSPLDIINKANVKDLKQIWSWEDTSQLGSDLFWNPIMSRNRLITLLPSNHLAAMNPETGAILWTFTPDSTLVSTWSKGLTYYKARKADDDLLYFVYGSTLYCLYARDGKLVNSFGKNGRVDYFEGLDYDRTKMDRLFVTNNSPGVIYKDLIILGSKVPDELPSVSGDIRAFNRHTGALVWTFNTIPKPGEFGADTWGPDARKKNGGANCWAGMALDEKRGLVYIPTGSPAFDYYGADRPGTNLFGNCLLALDANTGKRVWHYQTTHHDLWDRDNGSPPNLMTVEHNGKKTDAVGLVTKMGYLFLFDRENGTPLFDIEEVPVDTVSTMPGEKPWPSQPRPVKPTSFVRQTFKEEYISDVTPATTQYVKDEIKKHGYKTGWYEPPGLMGTLLLPAAHGGGNWGGASVNTSTNIMFVNANDIPWYFKILENKNFAKNNTLGGAALFKMYCSSCHGMDKKGTVAAPDISKKVIAYTDKKLISIISNGSGTMPSFKHLPSQQITNLINYLKDKNTNAGSFENTVSVQSEEPYTFAGYDLYTDTAGYYAVKPPFGTLTAIDLNKGVNLWQVPLGENQKLAKLGRTNTGDFNRGGGIATAGGLIFIGATYDRKLRAFDQGDGKVLWEFTLPGAATSVPSTFSVHGKQYVVVAVSPNKEYKGGYVGFGL